jgi:GntR family transcriptional repressor for pyruvate dehydrogenase complex
VKAVAEILPDKSKGDANPSERIWAVVREQKLRVGDQLPPIRELADRLAVKPSVVRDALLQAQAMGLVKVAPRAGAFLRALPPAPTSPTPLEVSLPTTVAFAAAFEEGRRNLLHLMDARRLIEIELVGRSAERRRFEDLPPVRRALDAMLQLPREAPRPDYVALDVAFHVEIARLAGNHVLFEIQRSLMEQLRPHLCNVPYDLQRRGVTDRSHVAVYEALVAGDAERARREMHGHLSLAYDGFLRDIQVSPAVGRASDSRRRGSAKHRPSTRHG